MSPRTTTRSRTVAVLIAALAVETGDPGKADAEGQDGAA